MNDYLSKDLLNDIENKVSNLHKLYREKFDLTETSLRNVQVNDDLSNRTLFLNFPWESYESITNDEIEEIITTDSGNNIRYRHNPNNLRKWVGYYYSDDKTNYILYSKYDSKLNNDFNYIRYKLPKEIGIVTTIDSSNYFYPYIKIKDDKYKLLEYIKKTWVEKEIPYLQYIDNIEEGINNVADILFKPSGYEYKKWTTVGYYGIEKNDYGLAQKPISQRDFSRWNKNIELLEEIIKGKFTIWNVVSYINWNKYCDLDWSDYKGKSKF